MILYLKRITCATGDFRTDYLLFDTYSAPFNDLNVRKAFAYALDREAIVKNVYGEIKAMPAHSMLMPGYPASDTKGELKQYQNLTARRLRNILLTQAILMGKGSLPRKCGCVGRTGNERSLSGFCCFDCTVSEHQD